MLVGLRREVGTSPDEASKPDEKLNEQCSGIRLGVRLYQSHSESIILATNAERNLEEARTTGEYQSFARAAYGFQESLDLWEGNDRARLLLAETEHDYANCAFGKEDYDLAASLLRSDNPEHAVLLDKVEHARQERDARQRLLRNFRRIAAALVLAVIADSTASVLVVST